MSQRTKKLDPMSPSTITATAAALRLLKAKGFSTLEEAVVYFGLAEAQLQGASHDICAGATLSCMPLSTFSRIAWSLHERGFLEYEPDPTDRRRKVLRVQMVAA